jgi:hypothetical protein
MKQKHVICLIFILISVAFLNTCKKINSEPTEPIAHEGPVLTSPLPYIKPPHIYITIDPKRMMCGTTIMDTLIKNPPNSIGAKFTTLSGDSEEFYLLMVSGTTIKGFIGLGYGIPLQFTDGIQIKNNGILEVNLPIDRITLTYNSFNDGKLINYSIAISDTMIFYPIRYSDRVP